MENWFEHQNFIHQKMIEFLKKEDCPNELLPLRKWMVEDDLQYAKTCCKYELHEMDEYISDMYEQYEGNEEMTEVISEMEEHSINLLQLRY